MSTWRAPCCSVLLPLWSQWADLKNTCVSTNLCIRHLYSHFCMYPPVLILSETWVHSYVSNSNPVHLAGFLLHTFLHFFFIISLSNSGGNWLLTSTIHVFICSTQYKCNSSRTVDQFSPEKQQYQLEGSIHAQLLLSLVFRFSVKILFSTGT